MFEVVEKPNGFIKNAKNQSGSSDLNKSQSERLEFWTQFNDVIVERGKPFKIRKASTDHWYDIAIGTSVGHVALNLVNKEGCVVVELYINDDKELYDSQESQKEEIEAKLNLPLEWRRLDYKKASRIMHKIYVQFNNNTAFFIYQIKSNMSNTSSNGNIIPVIRRSLSNLKWLLRITGMILPLELVLDMLLLIWK